MPRRFGTLRSVRLFEAAACGSVILSDNWPGLDTFFKPGIEILLPADAHDVERYLALDDESVRCIGEAAQRRVLSAHTNDVRARDFEAALLSSQSRGSVAQALVS